MNKFLVSIRFCLILGFINDVHAALWDNVQGKWKLANTTYTDDSGNGYTLTQSATPTATSGHYGGSNLATDFERDSSQYLYITDASAPNLSITGPITISAWVKPESSVAGEYKQITSKVGTSGNYSYDFFVSPTNYVTFRMSTNGTTIAQTVVGNTQLTNGVWYHVAAVYDQTDIRIYLNGVLDMTPVAETGAIYDSTVQFRIGNDPTGGQYFDGVIDDVAVFSRALSSTEIGDLQVLDDDFDVIGSGTISGVIYDSAGDTVNCTTYTVNIYLFRVSVSSTENGITATCSSAVGAWSKSGLADGENYRVIYEIAGTYKGQSYPTGAARIKAQ